MSSFFANQGSEFTERHKIEALLRELLDAKRNRKSEQLSRDQLALFAAAWQARQADGEMATKPNEFDDDDPGAAAGGESAPKKRIERLRHQDGSSEQ
jgi:hypothetical protein